MLIIGFPVLIIIQRIEPQIYSRIQVKAYGKRKEKVKRQALQRGKLRHFRGISGISGQP
jgi:hypothetical protein